MDNKQDSDNYYGNEITRTFTAIFNLHFDSLFNYGLRITGRRDLVEDCIQEVFFRIWKNNIDLNAVSNIKAYLIKALRRQLFNIFELKMNHLVSEEITENIGMEFSPEDFMIDNQTDKENLNLVLTALNNIPAKQREAIYLKYFEELSFAEVAAIMNINIQSAKNDVFRGLDTLKKMFILMMVFS
jgi:RNA polymerase sigma factor (sigma-70 family)